MQDPTCNACGSLFFTLLFFRRLGTAKRRQQSTDWATERTSNICTHLSSADTNAHATIHTSTSMRKHLLYTHGCRPLHSAAQVGIIVHVLRARGRSH